MLSRRALQTFAHVFRTHGALRLSSATSTRASKSPAIEEWFHYTKVIVSNVPDSFVENSLRFNEPKEPIDLKKARAQNRYYVDQLRRIVPKVIEIEPDARYPDMVFVEDPAVVLMDKAVICKIGHPNRQGESIRMKEVLENMNVETYDLRKMDPRATMDGGDVLFTGREFLVGLSGRTNKVSFSLILFVVWRHGFVTDYFSHPQPVV